MMSAKELIIAFTCLCFMAACKKGAFTDSPSALLHTTTNTLHFDTVFTTTGSISQVVKIVNNNKKGVRIASVQLAGGTSSFFKINVDGIPGPQVNEINVLPNDSIYVFVTVSIDPSASPLPFVVRDSIRINYNGNQQWVQLEAYGKNAHFLRNRIITTTETWNNDLPYVILGKLEVANNATLNINKGCQVHIHADAPFIVNGTLLVNGEKWDSTRVVFTGDRLDDPYRNFPASYPGLIFTAQSRDNVINYAIIKNAYQGILVTDPSPATKLTLNETIIDNAYDAGLLGINTSISAKNLLISNCGKNLMLVKGGDYDFTHCTVASFSNNYILHREPVAVVTNFLNQGGFVANPLNAVFTNCIFWGESNGFVENETVVLKQGSTPFSVVFDQVLWRNQANPLNSTIMGALSAFPEFDSINNGERIYNFRLKSTSPAINKGVSSSVIIDLDGNLRPVGLPDLGAYEKQ